MPYNKYNIDFKKLVIWLLPSPIRKPYAISWLLALINPLIRLHFALMAYRNQVIYRLTITPQVCYLEKLLNDRYDSVARRIRITENKEVEGVILYRKVENKPAYFYRKSEGNPVIYHTKAETSRFGVDFIVEVPAQVMFDMNELIETLSGYKLASKKFKVKIL